MAARKIYGNRKSFVLTDEQSAHIRSQALVAKVSDNEYVRRIVDADIVAHRKKKENTHANHP